MIYGLRQRGTLTVRYIGRTDKEPQYRLDRHIWHARMATSTRLVAEWIRACDFDVEMVALQERASDDRVAERRWIRRMRTHGVDLMNMNDGGDGPGRGSFTLTVEQRAKISESNRRRVAGQHQRELMRTLSTGRRHTDSARAKMSAARLGVPKSPGARANIAAANRRRGEKLRDIPLPTETRAKISAALKGQPKSETHKQNMREAWQRRKAKA